MKNVGPIILSTNFGMGKHQELLSLEDKSQNQPKNKHHLWQNAARQVVNKLVSQTARQKNDSGLMGTCPCSRGNMVHKLTRWYQTIQCFGFTWERTNNVLQSTFQH